ncbi:carboxylesterase/lipase family protein [Sphingomonas endophytica]|uniref:Carboxylic ester hydrolase n=1 Tax=Sphingomonas endophytica TaxID=869719 RepID=A0A147I6K5_9SPHN|nr:carboxylesterase family protein [Sphingomonas endophytica]KTT74396.1 carboxylesterase [Sphingomonas endophytica]
MSTLLAIALAAQPAAPVVRTDDGPVRGVAMGAGAVFRGIPYAAPPVGALRWRAPRRPHPWTTPRATIARHATCPQVSFGWNRADADASDEDCLFLDVRTPDLRPGARLPVLFWIHGGSNRAGSGAGPVESPIAERGLVVVSIQYRLGSLGFLSHPRLSREQGGHSGNYGLMDQQAALRWVKRNIAAFGGDPARVTIAGESAGAMDVGLHMLLPGSRALFAQAIAESGTAGFGTAPRDLASNERLGTLIAGRAGLRATATAAQLRGLSWRQVLAADKDTDVPGLDDDDFIWLQAVVDGRVLTDTPARLLAGGHVTRVPLLIGMNATELPLHGAAVATVRRAFGADADEALRLYGLQPGGTPTSDPRLADVTLQLANDLTFRCPVITVSNALSAIGGTVWQYQFDYAPPGGAVRHASELRYIFEAPQPGAPPLQAYWAHFVQTGTPNHPGLVRWPAYDRTARAYMAFDQSGPVAKTGLRRAICDLRRAP